MELNGEIEPRTSMVDQEDDVDEMQPPAPFEEPPAPEPVKTEPKAKEESSGDEKKDAKDGLHAPLSSQFVFEIWVF